MVPVAAALAVAVLVARHERPLPPRRIWGRLTIVAFGVVIGFPLFSALALRELGAAHSAVIVGVLPAATAIAAVARAGERPSGHFWLAALGGLAAVLAFATAQGAVGLSAADGFVLLAVVSAALAWLGFGYVTVFSMLLGFFAWYHGLALGGVARIGQIQLVQPLLTLAWATALLGEQIGPWTIVAALAILTCVVATQQARIHRA